MPILAHYEVDYHGRKVILLLTEKDAAKLGGRPVDEKMRTPQNKMRSGTDK